jgi:hypothetical protein
MAEHIDSLETAPSELLQKAVRGHIAPISQVLALQDEPATIVLQRLKRILSNPDSGKEELIKALGSKTTLDTAQLLGILAWHTNFDQSSGFQGAFLQAERVVQYSKGLVPSIEIAEQLLNAGAQAKIFDQAIGAFNNVYAWRDKLVADGCASLYLAYEIELGGMDDHTIAVCLECLHKKNSLDILALALDLTLILRIIEVIISTRADLAHILNSLLTVEVVDRLGRMSGCLDEVGRGLFQLAVVDLTRLPDVAAALARVIGSNENTRLECRASIRSSTPECMTALAALAIEHMDSDEFFRELEREPLPSFMAPVALEAAARVWTGEGWSKLGAEASSLLDSNVSEERVESAWFCWLNRQSIDHTLQVALRLIDGAENIRPKSAAFLAAVALKHIAKTSSPVDRQTRIEMFRRIGAHVKSLAAPDLYRRAADIVKWLAVLHAPEIFGPSDDWKLSRDGTVAFLRDPRRNSVNEIFSQLAKVRSWFRLASTSELKALGPVSGLELVNDSLGSDFSYAHNARLYAGQVQAWDGNKFTVVSKSQFQNESFLWRARFDLSSGS